MPSKEKGSHVLVMSTLLRSADCTQKTPPRKAPQKRPMPEATLPLAKRCGWHSIACPESQRAALGRTAVTAASDATAVLSECARPCYNF